MSTFRRRNHGGSRGLQAACPTLDAVPSRQGWEPQMPMPDHLIRARGNIPAPKARRYPSPGHRSLLRNSNLERLNHNMLRFQISCNPTYVLDFEFRNRLHRPGRKWPKESSTAESPNYTLIRVKFAQSTIPFTANTNNSHPEPSEGPAFRLR